MTTSAAVVNWPERLGGRRCRVAASTGIRASTGITAMSCTSRVTSVARPVSLPVMPRCCGDLHGDGGRGHGEREADDDRGVPAGAEQIDDEAENAGGGEQLRDAEPEHLVAHAPELERVHFEPDEKQHDDDAELGDDVDRLAVGDQPQAVGADDDAGDQIAEDGAQPQPFEHRHEGDGDDQQDQDGEQGISGHSSPPLPVAAISRRRLRRA